MDNLRQRLTEYFDRNTNHIAVVAASIATAIAASLALRFTELKSIAWFVMIYEFFIMATFTIFKPKTKGGIVLTLFYNVFLAIVPALLIGLNILKIWALVYIIMFGLAPIFREKLNLLVWAIVSVPIMIVAIFNPGLSDLLAYGPLVGITLVVGSTLTDFRRKLGLFLLGAGVALLMVFTLKYTATVISALTINFLFAHAIISSFEHASKKTTA